MDQTEIRVAQEEDTISLLDLLSVIAKRRRFIFFSTVIAAILIVLFSLYTLKVPAAAPYNPLPNQYTPEVKVRLLESQGSSLSSALQSSTLGALAGLAGISASGGAANADLAQALLKGNTLADDVAKHFDFIKRYHITKDPRVSTRRIFEKSLSTKYDSSTGILTITYTDINKKFATQVLSYTLDALQQRFNTLSSERVDAQKQYLQARLAQLQIDLKKAQDKLINYMVKHGIIDIASQAQAQVTQIAKLSSEIQSREIQLQTMKKYGRSETDPAVVQLKNDIQIEQNLINELKRGSNTFSINNIPQDQIPRVSATYLNLKDNLTLQETIYMTLRQQYETAKLEADASAKTFQVIERAEIPELKSGPSRGKISIIVTITVFFLAVCISFVMEYFDRVKHDPVESAKLNEIKRLFGKPRRE
jgi:capsule polysaccharide export protein KpsE/RkpR